MIGKETGRIVHFATHNEYCRTCDSAKKKKKTRKTPSTHDCRRNWTEFQSYRSKHVHRKAERSGRKGCASGDYHHGQ